MRPRRLERLQWVELEGCPRAYVATTAPSRLLGLAWLDGLPEGVGLLIPGCKSVHTFGMRFDLDVEFLDADWQVLRRVEAMPPRRLLWCRGAAAVLERKAGGLRTHGGRNLPTAGAG